MYIVDLRFCFCFFFGGGLLARKSIDNVDFAAGIVETIAKIAVTGACETFDRAKRARGRVVRPEASCGRKRLAAKPFSWWPSVLVRARGGTCWARLVSRVARQDVLGRAALGRAARQGKWGERRAGACCAVKRVGGKGAPGHAEPGCAAWRLGNAAQHVGRVALRVRCGPRRVGRWRPEVRKPLQVRQLDDALVLRSAQSPEDRFWPKSGADREIRRPPQERASAARSRPAVRSSALCMIGHPPQDRASISRPSARREVERPPPDRSPDQAKHAISMLNIV